MKDKLLVIPGHLGKDPGAVAAPSDQIVGDFGPPTSEQECWINLQQAIGFCIAWAASELCTRVQISLVVPNGEVKPGLIDVIDMKDPGKFTLGERIALANRLDSDILEIHNNASASPLAHGSEICVYRKMRGSKLSENTVIARAMLEELGKLGLRSRGVKERPDLDLLRLTKNLALISEAAFISNPRELQALDVDLDGFNESVGLALWLGYSKIYKKIKGIDK